MASAQAANLETDGGGTGEFVLSDAEYSLIPAGAHSSLFSSDTTSLT